MDDPCDTRRPRRQVVLVGAGVFVSMAALVYALVAMPIYLLASLDSNGRERAAVRNGLLVWGPSIALVVGAASAVGFAIWYRSGAAWRPDQR